ncbi:MAG: hypothetical protein ACRDN0_21745 [Trebonia sp.]
MDAQDDDQSQPDDSGTSATGSANPWVSSSDAPQKAAAGPAHARLSAVASQGAVRSAGLASSKVSADRIRPRRRCRP